MFQLFLLDLVLFGQVYLLKLEHKICILTNKLLSKDIFCITFAMCQIMFCISDFIHNSYHIKVYKSI